MNQVATQRDHFFRFLRRLRADGRSNMYGAVPYLMSAFSLDRETAFAVICEWLDHQAKMEPAEPSPRHRKPQGQAA
jgi:hypothetical protein